MRAPPAQQPGPRGPVAVAPAPGACPVCRGDLGPSETPAYAACGSCGVRASLVPEGRYDVDYYYHDAEFDRRCARRAAVQLGHVARLGAALPIRPAVGGPLRLLELGCAKGFFVEAAVRAGLDARGVDVALEAIAAGRDRGVEGRLFHADARGDLPTACGTDFDVVAAWELLEHMDDPAEFLRSAARHVRPGGWVIGSTPNGDSSWLALLGRHWHGFAIPQYHRVYLGARSFAAVAGTAGLGSPTTLSVTEPAGGFLLKNLATGLVRAKLGSDALPLRAAAAALLALPARLAERLAGRVGPLEGDTLLFAAQRP